MKKHLQLNLDWIEYDLREQFPRWELAQLRCEGWQALQSQRMALDNEGEGKQENENDRTNLQLHYTTVVGD
jgi:hypothetical protein